MEVFDSGFTAGLGCVFPACASIVWLRVEREPVSYTHLDVYKRQLFGH